MSNDPRGWRVTTSEMMQAGIIPDVILAGKCNYPSEESLNTRNAKRDPIGQWLTSDLGLSVFDVQIHTLTHGRGYEHKTDSPMEHLAREVAKLRVYQIGTEAPSPITHMEILTDAGNNRRSVVWFDSPRHFAPIGLGTRNEVREDIALREMLGDLRHSQVANMINGYNQMRVELPLMVADMPYRDAISFVDGDVEDAKAEILKQLLDLRVISL